MYGVELCNQYLCSNAMERSCMLLLVSTVSTYSTDGSGVVSILLMVVSSDDSCRRVMLILISGYC